jgi:hypothetical protein
MAQPPFAPAVAAQRKTSPIVWVLVIILGLFVLGGLTIAGLGFFVVHKVRQAGLDPDLMARNPGLAISKLVASTNPDIQVLNTDDGAGTITVRDRRTGKVTTLTFDQARNGQFSVTSYPGGSTPKSTFSASAGDGNVSGSFTFTTTDSQERVLSFYQDKCKELGLKTTNISSPGGGSVIGTDDATKRSLLVFVGTGSPVTVSVTYGLK